MQSIDTPFVAVLKSAYKNHSTLPDRCSISLGIDVNQNDYSDVVEIVAIHGGLDDLLSRLADSHPTDRSHLDEFDRQFWTVMNEAAAFAWAVEQGFTGVSFTDDNATTDVTVLDGPMIEAKTVDVSPEERAIKSRMAEASDRGEIVSRITGHMRSPHPNLLKKFEDGLQDALEKLARQKGGELIVYFELAGGDWPISRRQAFEQIEVWASDATRRTGARIVVWKSDQWRNPFLDTAR